MIGGMGMTGCGEFGVVHVRDEHEVGTTITYLPFDSVFNAKHKKFSEIFECLDEKPLSECAARSGVAWYDDRQRKMLPSDVEDDVTDVF